GHSGIYGNEQADKLAYLNSKNPDVKLNLPECEGPNQKFVSNNINKQQPTISNCEASGHITEYIQIKLSDKQNALLDKEHREFLKRHKFVL
ncbi:7585_t:CDS:2, partial [Racocetra persica]